MIVMKNILSLCYILVALYLSLKNTIFDLPKQFQKKLSILSLTSIHKKNLILSKSLLVAFSKFSHQLIYILLVMEYTTVDQRTIQLVEINNISCGEGQSQTKLGTKLINRVFFFDFGQLSIKQQNASFCKYERYWT